MISERVRMPTPTHDSRAIHTRAVTGASPPTVTLMRSAIVDSRQASEVARGPKDKP